MTTLIPEHTSEGIVGHITALAEYARRVLVEDDALTAGEEDDKAWRMGELMALGASHECTKAELVTLVYDGLFRTKRGCDCPTCQYRGRIVSQETS